VGYAARISKRRPAHLQKLAILVSFAVLGGCSDYAHIKVVDQNEQPVEGVLVRSHIQPGNAFFFKGETTVEYTDEQGRVRLPVGRWFRLTKVEKEGYQFRPTEQIKKEYGNSRLGEAASQFTADNPLVLRAWKRGEQPDLTYAGGKVFFPDKLDRCTVTLVEPTKANGLDEPLVWQFDLESEYRPAKEEYKTPTRQFKAQKWSGWTRMPGARLQGTDDLFMNRAPEQGYKDKVKWGPFVYGESPRGIREDERQLFIKGENGKFYGGAIFFIRPDRGTKAALSDVNNQGAYFRFWFNFDGSTNIMREMERAQWNRLDKFPNERVHCHEAPED